jgi:hypothetical protein
MSDSKVLIWRATRGAVADEKVGGAGPSWSVLPFERYMIEDDTAEYPMTFSINWEVHGQLDLDLLGKALLEVLEHHPLLNAYLGQEAGGKLVWKDRCVETGGSADAGGIPPFVWEETPERDWQRLDLSREGPLRVIWEKVVANSDDETEGRHAGGRLIFVFHHAASDGIGSLEFCGDVFYAYLQHWKASQRALGGVTEALHEQEKDKRVRIADRELIIERSKLDRSVSGSVSNWEALRFTVLETVRFFLRRAVVLRAKRVGNRGETSVERTSSRGQVFCWPDLWGITLSRHETDVLRRGAENRGATLNELVTAVLMEVVNEVVEPTAGRKRKGWLAVLVPINMRVRQRRRLPACNAIGYAFLKRARRDVAGWKADLPGIVAELRAIQSWKIGGMFLDALAKQEAWPRWMRSVVKRVVRPATFVFSFVGDPVRRFAHRLPMHDGGLVLGEATISHMAAAPPPRPGTEVAILGSLFGQQLTLWCRPSGVAFPGNSFAEVRLRIADRLQEVINEIQVEPMVSGGDF